MPAKVVGRVDAAGAGDVERGVDPERAVEVEVELGLGHRARDRAHRSLVEVGHAAMVATAAGRRDAAIVIPASIMFF